MRALAGVLREERHAHVALVQLGVGAELARQVAAIAGLDLDHVGAHVRELVASEGAGEHVGEVQHADALQRCVGHGQPASVGLDAGLP